MALCKITTTTCFGQNMFFYSEKYKIIHNQFHKFLHDRVHLSAIYLLSALANKRVLLHSDHLTITRLGLLVDNAGNENRRVHSFCR
ncbi:hypothetical protein GMAR_ORF29 [Golden Marseillevirus]|uniref:hypothetical protein n=1 Tax=Golden Marseillevirus TaxID=1720526 RepID=UPI000877AD2B|nr:hypothetical protein GMAR_ORF29 [Golden Marseillevirus]ALX27404.1 hypothetical protein GMAR_ORF29 [Golden Marseillevirus]